MSLSFGVGVVICGDDLTSTWQVFVMAGDRDYSRLRTRGRKSDLLRDELVKVSSCHGGRWNIMADERDCLHCASLNHNNGSFLIR
jgi:hypothetical protein